MNYGDEILNKKHRKTRFRLHSLRQMQGNFNQVPEERSHIAKARESSESDFALNGESKPLKYSVEVGSALDHWLEDIKQEVENKEDAELASRHLEVEVSWYRSSR